jgi:uncharacterized membrane protein
MKPGRRGYLDWLRGVAVLIMIGSHAIDSWTIVADRSRTAYRYAMMIAGIGAPIFLFLAGIALVLAAGSRLRGGQSEAAVAAAARRRGWEIFGLAFLFRFQAWALSGGPFLNTLLKVDILNVMGLAMLGAALLWSLGGTNARRATLYVAAVAAVAMLTPIVRATPLLDALPDPLEWYFRPFPGRTNFTLFPWVGFLLAGAALGSWLDRTQTADDERRLNLRVAALGPAIALGGYAASSLPAIYSRTDFWTSSPTFFFLRLGVILTLLPVAYAWQRRRWSDPQTRWAPLAEFGRSSLFVYWIHVEMVYGAMSAAIHRRLTFEQVLVAFVAFSVVLFALARLKERLVTQWRTRGLRFARV